MGRFFILALIYFTWLKSYSQNLVWNGSFENTISKIGDYHKKVDSFYALHWYAPTGCTVDIFRDKKYCTNEFLKSFEPILDFCIKVLNGRYAIGLGLINYQGSMEHITGELKEPMMKDSIYSISAYIKRASGKVSTPGFGFKFSSDSILFQNSVRDLNEISPFYTMLYKSRKIYSDFELDEPFYDTSWTRIEFPYKALGGERFLTLGKFAYDNDKKYITLFEKGLSKTRKEISKYLESGKSKIFFNKEINSSDNLENLDNYYFIDSVQVIKIKANPIDDNCPTCIDLIPYNSIPSRRVYKNLFDDRGLVGNATITMFPTISKDEKIVLHFGNNKELIAVSINQYEQSNEKRQIKVIFKYPVKKLRGFPLIYYVSKLTESDKIGYHNRSKSFSTKSLLCENCKLLKK